jgi:phage shock protein E
MIQAIKNLLGLGPIVDYAQLMKQGAIIVDVRTKGEYAEGAIKGSLNIPVDSLNSQLSKLKDKNKPIVTCCASGMRSAAAKRILTSNGYIHVYNGGSWHSLQSKLR